MAIETLPHILIECEPVKVFWNELKYWLSLKSGIFLQPTVSEIITGFQNPDLVMFSSFTCKMLPLSMFNINGFSKYEGL